MKCKPSWNSHVGHLNLIHGSTKIRYVGLNWFKRWSFYVFNCRDWVWYMKILTFELGRVLSMQSKVRNQWQIKGVGLGVRGSRPPHPNWCLFEQYSFSKAVFSVPTVTCVRRLRNMCLSLWEVILKKFNISFWTKVWTLPSPQTKIPGSAPGNTIIHSREWKT